MGPRKVITIDCETDPFLKGRVPAPFIWGSYDGREFKTFKTGKELCDAYKNVHCYLYAHNGGKFDFMFLLAHISETRVKLINSRIAEMGIGKALLRDSFSIIPTALKSFQKTEIEYWKLEKEHRRKHWREIVSYLKDDCVNLWELVTEYHKAAGKGLTIAGNALTFAKKLGLDPGKTSNRFDKVFRQFYYGGRVEAFKGGVFSNVNVYDINSAYPFAMSHEHGSGPRYIVDDTLEGYSNEQIQKAFITLSCYSRGAFPVRDDYGLRFPAAIGTYHVTGWEYLAAIKHDLISGIKIREVLMLEDKISFQKYVNHWFHHKQHADKKGDKAQRLIGKIMMNSLYGKLAQNPIHYFDYKIVPSGSPLDELNGWQLGPEFNDKEIHERPTLWRWQQEYGEDWVKFPCYYNVATAASITGFTRAHLLDAIHTMGVKNVLYCDTDCLFLSDGAPVSRLAQTGALGSWSWEGLANPCYIAGKKLYGLEFVNGPQTGEQKLATKGARLNINDIKRLCEGETIVWENDAPTFSIGQDTKFLVRSIRATAQMD